ncbi:cell division protein FtsB [Orrella daihaiensis]|uniref:Cell division protein FtsB n=1 Tax=Orrella daihaiensis TaxID=2782176 RepID=A0ABY4AHJ6_9BURK|nr:cell division protein FtsB [Orrella daihaiensis]UOD49553.1 cell division protein FtsB [Orrella daihaiensis]
MRLIFLTLLVLFVLVQYPLWFGQGGWLAVWDLQAKVAEQQSINEGLKARNQAMEAEVEDLRTGKQASEERARRELGLMQENEVFIQVLPAQQPHNGSSAGAGASNLN